MADDDAGVDIIPCGVFRDLTEKQRRFVMAYIGEARGVAYHAARIAGYATPHSAGHRVMQSPTVRAAIDAAFATREMDAVSVALEIQDVLLEILRYGDRDSDRIRAADTLARLRGLMHPSRHEVTVDAGDLEQLPAEELIARHREAIRRLEATTRVIDAEVVEARPGDEEEDGE